MKLGELVDTLAALNVARDDVDPPMTAAEWRDLPIVVRGMDDDGNDFCGDLVSVGIETGCGDSGEFLALDASNSPEHRAHPDSWLDCPECKSLSKAGAKPPRCPVWVAKQGAQR